jgi:hypothetical protein
MPAMDVTDLNLDDDDKTGENQGQVDWPPTRVFRDRLWTTIMVMLVLI